MEQQNNKIEWTTHLARKHPGKAAILLVGMAAVGVSGYLFHLRSICIVAPLFLLVSCAEFLFKTKFTLNETGVIKSYLYFCKYIQWGDVASYSLARSGVWLNKKSVLKGIRNNQGMLLHLPDEKDDIIAYIKSHVKEDNAN